MSQEQKTDEIVEVAERYGRVAGAFDARLAALPAGDWGAQTPCSEWDVRALVAHVVEVHRRMGALLDGGQPAPVTEGEDLVAGWRAAREVVDSALSDNATACRVVDTGFMGELPFVAVVGGLLCADTLIHTWDLARATGQPDRLDPAAVSVAFELLQGFGDAIRSPGAFGPAVDPGPAADEQARFIAFCGRSA